MNLTHWKRPRKKQKTKPLSLVPVVPWPGCILALTTVMWKNTFPFLTKLIQIGFLSLAIRTCHVQPFKCIQTILGNQILRGVRGPRWVKNPFSRLSSGLFTLSCSYFLVFGFFTQRSALLTQGMNQRQGSSLLEESSGRGFFLEERAMGSIRSVLLAGNERHMDCMRGTLAEHGF